MQKNNLANVSLLSQRRCFGTKKKKNLGGNSYGGGAIKAAPVIVESKEKNDEYI